MKVKAKVATIHPKYGAIEKGQELNIDEADFGEEVFEKIKSKALTKEDNK